MKHLSQKNYAELLRLSAKLEPLALAHGLEVDITMSQYRNFDTVALKLDPIGSCTGVFFEHINRASENHAAILRAFEKAEAFAINYKGEEA